MNIIITGFKGIGKSTFGEKLAISLNKKFIDTDDLIENLHKKEKKEKLSFRQIYKNYGKDYFRKLERKAVNSIKHKNAVIALGGGTLEKNFSKAKKLGTIVYLKYPKYKLYSWIKKSPPVFIDKKRIKKSFEEVFSKRRKIYEKADIIINCSNKSYTKIIGEIKCHLL